MDRYASVKTKIVTVRPKVPWYTEEIHKAKIECRRAERKWRSSAADSDFRLFKKRRNCVTYLLKMAKSSFLTAFIDKNSDDPGKLFKAVKNLLVEKEKLSFPGYSDETVLVNDIGNFFVQKISSICDELDNVVPQDFATETCNVVPSFGSFVSLSEDDVHYFSHHYFSHYYFSHHYFIISHISLFLTPLFVFCLLVTLR